MRHTRAQIDRCGRHRSIDYGMCVVTRTADAKQENPLSRIGSAVRRENYQRTVESGRQLHVFVRVGVIDESPRSLRRHSHHERITRRDGWRQETVPATPVADAIVITLQLDSMPMDRGGRFRAIDDGDLCRLVLTDCDRRAENSYRIESRWRWSFLEDVAVARLVAVHVLLLDDKNPQTPSRRILLCEREFSLRQDAQADDESGHPTLGVIHVANWHRRVAHGRQPGCVRHVRDDMTVKDPVAWSGGHPGHRHR